MRGTVIIERMSELVNTYVPPDMAVLFERQMRQRILGDLENRTYDGYTGGPDQFIPGNDIMQVSAVGVQVYLWKNDPVMATQYETNYQAGLTSWKLFLDAVSATPDAPPITDGEDLLPEGPGGAPGGGFVGNPSGAGER